MTFGIVAKNATQKIAGSTVSSGETIVTVAAPLIAYTVPAGKTEKLHVLTQTRLLSLAQNLRYRVNGFLIYQVGINQQFPSTGLPNNVDLGIFVLNGGQTVSCTTSNVGTEGGTAIMTVSVLQSTPT